jgi:Mg-chelatase subunit ChlD
VRAHDLPADPAGGGGGDVRAVPRTPVDLVLVLDTSGSMMGSKLAMLKSAVRFVLSELRDDDRVSLISFNGTATRVTPLRRMTTEGRASSERAVMSLCADGGTSITAGLDAALGVLCGRRSVNLGTACMLLTDGHGAFSTPASHFRDLDEVRPRANNTGMSCAVHTFGVGADHDAALLQRFAADTGGTYSFVDDSRDRIAQAFAATLAAVTTVAGTRVSVTLSVPGTSAAEIVDVENGAFAVEGAVGPDTATVVIPSLSAGESKSVPFVLRVSGATAGESGAAAPTQTRTSSAPVQISLDVKYRAPGARATGASTVVPTVNLTVARSAVPAASGIPYGPPNAFVTMQRLRVLTLDATADAREIMSHGNDRARASEVVHRAILAVETTLRAAGGAVGGLEPATALLEDLKALQRIAPRLRNGAGLQFSPVDSATFVAVSTAQSSSHATQSGTGSGGIYASASAGWSVARSAAY